MANRDKIRARTNARSKQVISIAMLGVAFTVSCFVAILLLTPKRYHVSAGAVSQDAILATRSIEDQHATELLKQRARDATVPTYRIDEEAVKTLSDSVTAFFNGLEQIRTGAQAIRQAGGGIPGANLSAQGWSELLTAEETANLLSMTDPRLTEQLLYQMLSSDDAEITLLRDILTPKLTTALSNGLSADALDRVKNASVQELRATTLSDALKDIGVSVLGAYMQPTYVVDEQKTSQSRESAAAAVEPVMINRGDVIVSAGSEISEAQMALLRELDLVRSDESDLLLAMGVIVYLLAVYALFLVYLLLCKKQVLENIKSMLIICAAVVIVMLSLLLTNPVSNHLTLGLMAVLLTALLVGESPALAVCLVMAASIGLVAGGRGAAMMQLDSMTMTASSIAAGVAAVFMLRFSKKRGTIVLSGAVGGAAAAVVIIGIYVMVGKGVWVVLEDAAWAAGSCIFSAVFCVGTLSIWENLFDIATDARLNELLNTNHPLLKQLMTEAPGTYQHSVMVAALAEGAAEAVGANPLLARVGAYYHDAGKLRRPLYFKENQKSGENIHDAMSAADSASVIISHQRDGVTLLNKFKLPSAVVQIAAEHHGNTMMAYFYHKATKEAGAQPPNPKAFRYPGCKPSTRESAIVMLADSSEAAVRSLGDTTRESMEEMVHKVIRGKMDDGQLNAAPITLQELAKIERSFLKTLFGLLHERIEYPEISRREPDDAGPARKQGG